MTEAIVAAGLGKRYAGDVDAVRGVSFRVSAGEIVGLLGPNGAGKSTTLNMLATLVAPTIGEAWIFGRPVTDRAGVRPILGVALQVAGLDPLMSVRRHFEVQAALCRMEKQRVRRRSRQLIEDFGLEQVGGRRVGELSGGTQRRLSLALALLHEPRAIILDEPTVGLDLRAKRALWDLLLELRAKGLAVLLSTHHMDEAERLCDRIEVIAGGKIVASGTSAELKAEVTAGTLRILVGEHAERAASALRIAVVDGSLPPGLQFRVDAGVLQVRAQLLDPSFIPLLTLLLGEVGVDITEMSWGHGSLEEVIGSLHEPNVDGSDLPASMMVEHHAVARRR